jgi:hypothetical protein
MRDGVGLIANQIVEAVCTISINEAVANPFSGSDAGGMSVTADSRRYIDIPLIDICDDFESSFYTVIFDLASLNSSKVVLSREAQDVKRVFTGKCDEFSALRPIYLARLALLTPTFEEILTCLGSTSILRTKPPVCQSKSPIPPCPLTPRRTPPERPSAWKPTSSPPAFSTKFLYIRTLVADSLIA